MSEGRINWSRIDEATFNDLAEALLVRDQTQPGQIAMAIDGRGGDGGIDVDVRAKRTNQLIGIYQLKYFPEGFSGGHVKRRAQIKRSLLEALKLDPPVWTLVVPKKVTVKERQAVRGMRGGHKAKIRFVTPTEMDLLLAKYPDIEARFTIDHAIELLSAVHRAEAALVKPDDLRTEVLRMSDRLHGRSEYWGTAFAMTADGTYTETYFPKRPDASDREPLGLNFTVGFTPEDEDLQNRFDGAMKFGAIEPITLPSRVVQAFEKTGPEWFREATDEVVLELRPEAGVHSPKPVRVEVRDEEQRTVAHLRGRTTGAARGLGGMTVDVNLAGGVTLRWMLPADAADAGYVSCDFDFVGVAAKDIRRSLRFLAQFKSGATIALSLDGQDPHLVSLQSSLESPGDPIFEEFINDVCQLEDHFDLALPLPEHIDGSDIVWARVMRLLLEGHATAHPYSGTFGGTLNGTSDPGLDTLLDVGAALVISSERFTIEFFDETLTIDGIAYYTHHAIVDDAEQVRQALATGTAAGRKLHVRPVDGLPWVIYSPKRLEGTGRENVITQPWNLPSGKEHSGYGRLPNRLGNQ